MNTWFYFLYYMKLLGFKRHKNLSYTQEENREETLWLLSFTQNIISIAFVTKQFFTTKTPTKLNNFTSKKIDN